MKKLGYILLLLFNPITVSAIIVSLIFILKPEGFEALTGVNSRDDFFYTFLGIANAVSWFMLIPLSLIIISFTNSRQALKILKYYSIGTSILVIIAGIVCLAMIKIWGKSQIKALEITKNIDHINYQLEYKIEQILEYRENLSIDQKNILLYLETSKLLSDDVQKENLIDGLLVRDDKQIERIVEIFIKEEDSSNILLTSQEYIEANELAKDQEEIKEIFESRKRFIDLQKKLFYEIDNFEYKSFK